MHSTCRFCRSPVIFSYLPELPEAHEKRKFRARYMIWHHRKRPLGEELHCDGTQQRAAPREYCVEHVQGDIWSGGRTCNRPVKDFDLFMCGIHARHKRDEDRKRKERQEKMAISDYIFSNTLELQTQIKERFGLDTKSHYNWHSHEYDGLVTLNPRELLDLLESMLDNQDAPAPPEEDEWADFVDHDVDEEFEDFF